jgi:hypothetical protein
MLQRALYLVSGLKAPIASDGDLKRANAMYNEAVNVLQFLGLKQLERV